MKTVTLILCAVASWASGAEADKKTERKAKVEVALALAAAKKTAPTVAAAPKPREKVACACCVGHEPCECKGDCRCKSAGECVPKPMPKKAEPQKTLTFVGWKQVCEGGVCRLVAVYEYR